MKDRVRMAVVGLRFGMGMLKNQMVTGPGAAHVEVKGVCDLRQDVARQAAGELGLRAYADLDEVLADSEIEAVGLFTPPGGRADLIQRIVRAGRRVMTTKPVEVDPVKALAVLREARELGMAVHLNSPGPLESPALAQLSAWRKQYSLGAPVSARAFIYRHCREQADGSWYDDPERCPAPPILRLGIYLINDITRVMGEPVSVCAMDSRLFTGRPTTDNAQIMIRFANGALGHVLATFGPETGRAWMGWEVGFEKGVVRNEVDPSQEYVETASRTNEMTLTRDGGERRPVTERRVALGGNSVYQWEAFARACRGEKLEGEISPEQVVAGARVLAAVARSLKSGREEKA